MFGLAVNISCLISECLCLLSSSAPDSVFLLLQTPGGSGDGSGDGSGELGH